MTDAANDEPPDPPIPPELLALYLESVGLWDREILDALEARVALA